MEGKRVYEDWDQGYIDCVSCKLAKRIVDVVYSTIQAKMGTHLAIYESHRAKEGCNSKWFDGQIKRYKHMLNHVSFLRNNRAYWKTVASLIKEELTNGN